MVPASQKSDGGAAQGSNAVDITRCGCSLSSCPGRRWEASGEASGDGSDTSRNWNKLAPLEDEIASNLQHGLKLSNQFTSDPSQQANTIVKQ